MKTDIQIARECKLDHISEIATRLGIPAEEIEPYGRYMAKVPISLIDEKKVKKSNNKATSNTANSKSLTYKPLMME